jgi:hypothetical protein
MYERRLTRFSPWMFSIVVCKEFFDSCRKKKQKVPKAEECNLNMKSSTDPLSQKLGTAASLVLFVARSG